MASAQALRHPLIEDMAIRYPPLGDIESQNALSFFPEETQENALVKYNDYERYKIDPSLKLSKIYPHHYVDSYDGIPVTYWGDPRFAKFLLQFSANAVNFDPVYKEYYFNKIFDHRFFKCSSKKEAIKICYEVLRATRHYGFEGKTKGVLFNGDMMYLSDIHSSEVDPRITIEYINSFNIGKKFPDIQGISTATYAHQSRPDLPLSEAIKIYLENEPRTPVTQMTKKYPYDFINKIDGIVITYYGNPNFMNCSLQWIANSKNFDPQTLEYHHKTVFENKLFFVDSVKESTKICQEILKAVKKRGLPGTSKVLMFSGDTVFVAF